MSTGVKEVTMMSLLSLRFLYCSNSCRIAWAHRPCASPAQIQRFITRFLMQFDRRTRLHKSCSICAGVEMVSTDARDDELWPHRSVWSRRVGRTLSHSKALETNCSHCLCNYFEILCQHVSQVCECPPGHEFNMWNSNSHTFKDSFLYWMYYKKKMYTPTSIPKIRVMFDRFSPLMSWRCISSTSPRII